MRLGSVGMKKKKQTGIDHTREGIGCSRKPAGQV
jgi:hypothetical protein